MSHKLEEIFQLTPTLLKIVAHSSGGFGVLFFGTGLVFLAVTLFRLVSADFSDFGVGVGFALVLLAIGILLILVAKRILGDVRRMKSENEAD